MSSLPLHFLNTVSLVAVESECYSFKFPQWFKSFPVSMDLSLPFGLGSSEGLLFCPGGTGAHWAALVNAASEGEDGGVNGKI